MLRKFTKFEEHNIKKSINKGKIFYSTTNTLTSEFNKFYLTYN
jgi:hypothetical protein